jgi:hypothetical protein
LNQNTTRIDRAIPIPAKCELRCSFRVLHSIQATTQISSKILSYHNQPGEQKQNLPARQAANIWHGPHWSFKIPSGQPTAQAERRPSRESSHANNQGRPTRRRRPPAIAADGALCVGRGNARLVGGAHKSRAPVPSDSGGPVEPVVGSHQRRRAADTAVRCFLRSRGSWSRACGLVAEPRRFSCEAH